MEENNLDKYFQEKLAGHSEEPSKDVWLGISDQLSKSGGFWNKRYLLLLLLLISISGAGYLGYRLYQVDSRVAELEQKVNSPHMLDEGEKINSTDLQESQKEPSKSAEESRKMALEENAQTISKTDARKKQMNESLSELGSANAKESENDAFPVAASADKQSSQSENSLDVNKANEKVKIGPTYPNISKNLGVAGRTDSRKEYSIVTSGNRVSNFSPTFIDSRTPESMVLPEFISEPRAVDYYTPQKDWFLFVYGMANCTHRRVIAVSEGSEGIPNQLDNIENGLVTPGAGLQISRELGKSFRISAGIEYNQWIQEGTYSTTIPFETVELVVNTATQTSEYNFDGIVFGSLGATSFNSSSAENPFDTGFETLSPNSELDFDIMTRRRIDYLSIPITFEYVLKTYPFTFTAGAGISVNPIINSQLEFSIADSLPDLNFKSDNEISGTYFAFHLAVAVEYGISERMSIRLSPTYRGWMNPIFENEEIRTVPFGVAIRGGVIYRLGK